jgi:hypothetical protein
MKNNDQPWDKTGKNAKEQFDHDIEGWDKTLDANSKAASAEAKAAANVMKRMFIAIDSSEVNIQENKKNGQTLIDPRKQYMPNAALLSHGDRIVLEFDTEASKKSFASWLISGNTSDGVTKSVKHSNVVEERPMSTHTMGDNGVERKGQTAAAINVLYKATDSEDRQFGMSIGFGGENNKDAKGQTIQQNDGSHGYLFMNISKTNQSILIGIENSAYGKQGEHASEAHGLKGFTNAISFTGNDKFSNLSENDKEYNLPSDVGQIRIKLTKADVARITSKDVSHFNNKMLSNSTDPASIKTPTKSIAPAKIRPQMSRVDLSKTVEADNSAPKVPQEKEKHIESHTHDKKPLPVPPTKSHTPQITVEKKPLETEPAPINEGRKKRTPLAGNALEEVQKHGQEAHKMQESVKDQLKPNIKPDESKNNPTTPAKKEPNKDENKGRS